MSAAQIEAAIVMETNESWFSERIRLMDVERHLSSKARVEIPSGQTSQAL